jgi:hypothetical protein
MGLSARLVEAEPTTAPLFHLGRSADIHGVDS